MNEIVYSKTYTEYKRELDAELSKSAESFVRIGYLLKVARDTDILAESGYKNMAEFANAEYGLSSTYVSRFIRINDKFSEGGYSDHLLPEYQGFGYAKLTLMLQLPEAINEALTPKYSKSDIQAIKDEVDQEKKVTDIERALEGTEEKPLIEQIIFNIGKEHPELYLKISQKFIDGICTQEDIAECMAPKGIEQYTARILGLGAVKLFLDKDGCRIVVIRSGEKEDTTWEIIRQQWEKIYGSKEKWEELYGEKFPEKEEIAPVQQETPKVVKPVQQSTEITKDEPQEKVGQEPEEVPENEESESIQNEEQTLHDVEPSIPEPDPIPEPEHVNEADVEVIEPQIPGQDTVENHKEWMPGEIPDQNEQQANENQLRGYRAAVTNKLNRINNLWKGEHPEKISIMLDVMEDLKWDLEKLEKYEEETKDEI